MLVVKHPRDIVQTENQVALLYCNVKLRNFDLKVFFIVEFFHFSKLNCLYNVFVVKISHLITLITYAQPH